MLEIDAAKMEIAQKIRQRREELNMSQEDLAKILGYKSRSSIYKIEIGENDIPYSKIYDFAHALSVSPQYLMGWEESDTIIFKFAHPTITTDTVTFPVIGEIAAGYESIAIEDWSGETVEVPSTYLKGRRYDDFLVLSVKGDSMYPHFMDGDIVLVLRQTFANNNGDVCAVIYNDEMATLKKVFTSETNDYIELVPINPEYKPKRIEGEEIEHVHIIGIPKMLIREFDN